MRPAPPLPLRLPHPTVLCRAAFLLAAAAAHAVPPASDYFYRGWRIDNGLPDNSVNTVLQDRQNYVWLATMTGLVRFDGHHFQEFPLPAPLRETGENIRALAREDATTLVMLPASGGVMEFHDGQFFRHPVDAAVRGRNLQQLFVAPDGALWLGDGDGHVLRWKGGELTDLGKPDGQPAELAGVSMATDGRGRTWVAKGDFLGWLENGRLVRFPIPVGTKAVIAAARSGGLWISTDQQLLKWDQDRLETLGRPPDWPAVRSVVQHLYEDSQGVLWIATRRSGLFQFAAGRLQAVPTQQERLSWVTEDSEQGIWVASLGGGVTRLQRRPFVSVYPGTGQTDIASTAVCEDATGAVWCANRTGGVVRSFGGAVEHVREPPGAPDLYANSVSCDAAGTVWVGASSGLYRVRAGPHPALESVAPQLRDIHVLYGSRNGDLWIGSGYAHLGQLRQGAYREITTAQGYDGKFITAMAETADGRLWIASEHALYTFAQDRLVRVPELDRFASERLNALHGDQGNALWLGTSRGLLRLDHGRLAVLSQASGLPNERIEQILEDDRGMFWFGSRRGFFYVPRAELQAVADGRRDRFDAVTFGPEEGLMGQVPVPNCQPNTWKGRGDRLWFCTQQGVIGIAVDDVPRRLPPPPVYIDRILVDGRAADTARLRLPAGGHRLVFYFASPSFAAPEKVRLRHRLTGFDSAWIETASDQEANYTGLAPGRYTLDVTASDSNGIWREDGGTSLSFVVIPAWWETWWFRGLALAALIGAITGLARRASHRLLRRRLQRIEQEHALEKERARIARDLHDELGGSLTQIGLLADRLKRGARPEEMGAGFELLAWRTRQLAGELESIIWTVNPRNNSLDRFAAFVRQFALRFFRDAATTCTVLGVDEIPPLRLNPEVQHHLLSVTKEALNNVLKHARAGQVALSLHFSDGTLRMAVQDTGIGFDPAAPENNERNGLTNMASRLREIGATLEIRSVPGQGTTVAWQVPLRGLTALTTRAAPALSEP